MVRLTKIYTRGGDKGMTSLADGARRPEHDMRVEAYGTVDETNAAIGVARLYVKAAAHNRSLACIQQDLFDLGADLSTPGNDHKSLRILPAQVTRLGQEIDAMNKKLAPLSSFVLPAGSPAAAFMHLARTICRRAERCIAVLAVKETINPQALIYMNRLSDYLFVSARIHNQNGQKDVLWTPGGMIPRQKKRGDGRGKK